MKIDEFTEKVNRDDMPELLQKVCEQMRIEQFTTTTYVKQFKRLGLQDLRILYSDIDNTKLTAHIGIGYKGKMLYECGTFKLSYYGDTIGLDYYSDMHDKWYTMSSVENNNEYNKLVNGLAKEVSDLAFNQAFIQLQINPETFCDPLGIDY